MSLVLVYFEFPSKGALPAAVLPLVAAPVSVHIVNRGVAGATVIGVTMTDGLSSERLLRYGNTVAARHGERLREQLIRYVRGRLAGNVCAYVVLRTFVGMVTDVSVNLSEVMLLSVGELERDFGVLRHSSLLRLMSL